MSEQITYAEYMAPSASRKEAFEKHHKYHLQFATKQTYAWVVINIGMERLRQSKDPYLNDIGIKHSNGGTGNWIWDFAPVNRSLMKELGAPSAPSSITSIAKSAARELLKQEGIHLD